MRQSGFFYQENTILIISFLEPGSLTELWDIHFTKFFQTKFTFFWGRNKTRKNTRKIRTKIYRFLRNQVRCLKCCCEDVKLNSPTFYELISHSYYDYIFSAILNTFLDGFEAIQSNSPFKFNIYYGTWINLLFVLPLYKMFSKSKNMWNQRMLRTTWHSQPFSRTSQTSL